MPDMDLPGMDFFNMPPGGYGGGEEMPLPDDLLPVLSGGCWAGRGGGGVLTRC